LRCFIMWRSFDVGVTSLFVVLLVVGEQLQDSVAINSPAAKKTSDGSFSVWFRPEPGLPRKKDMKVDKLNRLIGADYNEMWMSKTAIVITVRLTIILFACNVCLQYCSCISYRRTVYSRTWLHCKSCRCFRIEN